MNYVLRMEDYDEDMECNTEVGTRVLHPSYRLQIISGVSFNLHKSVSVIPKLQDRERATRNMKTTGKVFPSQRDKLVI